MFAMFPELVKKALNIVLTRPTQVKMMELDEDGTMMVRPVLQPALIFSYRSLFLLFPAGE